MQMCTCPCKMRADIFAELHCPQLYGKDEYCRLPNSTQKPNLLVYQIFHLDPHTTDRSLENRDRQMYGVGRNRRLKVAQESGKPSSFAYQCLKQQLLPCSLHLIYSFPRMLYPKTVIILLEILEKNSAKLILPGP